MKKFLSVKCGKSQAPGIIPVVGRLMQQKIWMLFMALFLFFSCSDEYQYLKEEPGWIGENIYQTLSSDGRFSSYVKMLNRMDEDYIEILKRTGSRTLFVPTDEAFTDFFKGKPYGWSSVDDMPLSAVQQFLTYYTLENAYVTSVLGTSPGTNTASMEVGNCLRRYTTLLETDSIPYVDNYPDNPYFKKFQGKKIYLTTPGRWTLVNFTQEYFNKKGISNEDFNEIFPGTNRQNGDTYIFGAKVIQGNVVTKNGYIHVLDKVVLPPKSMYEYIRDNDNISIFKKLIERFCQPVSDAAATKALWDRHPEITDSVYTITFFDVQGGQIVDEFGNTFVVDKLMFSPARNAAQVDPTAGVVPSDMVTMLIPSNQAMENYFANSFLASYGSWDNVPDDLVAKFVNTHMKRSYLSTLPTKVEQFIDDVKGDTIELKKTDLIDKEVCRNGLVYTIDKIIGPRDFSTVVAPLFKSDETRIFNWIINESYNNKALKFNYYLTSLKSMYTLFVPVDGSFIGYLDPSWQRMNTLLKRRLDFKYYPELKGANYIYTNMDGDSIAAPAKPDASYANTTGVYIQNRLQDIVNYHIVIGEIDPNQEYVQSKGGAYIKIDRSTGQMRFQGSADIENGTYANIIRKYDINNGVRNGTVYFIDKRIEHTLTSPYVYGLSENSDEDCRAFFELLETYNKPDEIFFPENNNYNTKVAKEPEYLPPVFFRSASEAGIYGTRKDYGINYNIPFLGLYNYTLFVPNNAAIKKAFEDGIIKDTTDIKGIENIDDKINAIKDVIQFLKNHFMDESILVGQFYQSGHAPDFNTPFTTAARNPATQRFYNLMIVPEAGALVIKNAKGDILARTVPGKTNTMARQYRFANETDGSNLVSNTRLVIHQIDHVLPLNK